MQRKQHKMKTTITATFTVIVVFICTLSKAADITISFKNFYGENPVAYDSVTYQSSLGQHFTITNLKYYIGKIELVTINGDTIRDNNYLLVDALQDNNSITIHTQRKENIKAIRFITGVDSVRNCSGLQEGALDPVHAMFWAWNTGYIFFKLEGKAEASPAPGHIFEFHTGGFREPFNSVRTIELPLPLNLSEAGNPTNTIGANLEEVFRQPLIIDFKKDYSITDAQHSSIIVNNYTDMFSIREVK